MGFKRETNRFYNNGQADNLVNQSFNVLTLYELVHYSYCIFTEGFAVLK